MSFISRTIKRVFDFGKRVIKRTGDLFENKWFRTAFLVGMTFFTAGLGSAGFAGFSNAMQAAGGGIGGFFSAVGQTVAQGYGSIVSSVSKAFTSAKNFGKAALNVNKVAGAVDQGTSEPIPEGAGDAGSESGGFFKSLIGSIFSESKTGDFLRGAISGGISYWAKNKQYEDERERRDNATIAGGPAFGGRPDLPEGFIRKPVPQYGQSALNGQQAVNPQVFAPTPSPTIEQPLLGRATQIRDLPLFNQGGPQPLLGGAV